jgi:hypothetical protein
MEKDKRNRLTAERLRERERERERERDNVEAYCMRQKGFAEMFGDGNKRCTKNLNGTKINLCHLRLLYLFTNRKTRIDTYIIRRTFLLIFIIITASMTCHDLNTYKIQF